MKCSLLKVSDYIKLLLNKKTSLDQAIALLTTANKDQLNGICEIFHNSIYGELKLAAPLQRKLKRRQKILDYLLNKSNPVSKRHIILRDYAKFLLKIILSLRNQVLTLLKQYE